MATSGPCTLGLGFKNLDLLPLPLLSGIQPLVPPSLHPLNLILGSGIAPPGPESWASIQCTRSGSSHRPENLTAGEWFQHSPATEFLDLWGCSWARCHDAIG